MSDEIVTRLNYDPGERLVIAHTWQDVEDIIERNKQLKTMPQKRGRSWHHKASIPNNIYYQWMVEEWNRGNTKITMFSEEMDKVVARKLSDPDWAHLRTDK